MKWLLLKKLAVPAALFLVAVLGVSHYWVYQQGQKHANLELLEELDEARIEQARLTDELEQAKKGRRVVYRDRVRTVYVADDPSGCADVRVPDGVLGTLGYTDRPEADGTVGPANPVGSEQP